MWFYIIFFRINAGTLRSSSSLLVTAGCSIFFSIIGFIGVFLKTDNLVLVLSAQDEVAGEDSLSFSSIKELEV